MRSFQSSCVSCFLAFVGFSRFVSGFVAPTRSLSRLPTPSSLSTAQPQQVHSFRSSKASSVALQVSFSSNNNRNSNNRNNFNGNSNPNDKRTFMENARRSLERIFGSPQVMEGERLSSSSSSYSKPAPLPPILTPLGRKHRQLEIRLLESLRHSDEAIDELVTLWMEASAMEAYAAAAAETGDMDEIVHASFGNKRGFVSKSHAAVTALQWMENSCDQMLAERTLRELIDDCPTWTEPPARLALLLFYQGRYTESYKFNQLVLGLKPWHFEALQLQVLLFLVSADRAGAIWAARCGLPPIHQNKKRTAWIAKAVQMAKNQLSELERQHEAQEQHERLMRMMNGSIHDTPASHRTSSSLAATFFSDAQAYSQDDAWQ